MITWINKKDPLLIELTDLDKTLLPYFEGRNSTRLVEELSRRYSANQVATASDEQRIWEVAGLLFLNHVRIHEALTIFWRLYMHMLKAQNTGQYIHKGLPLLWIAECFDRLHFPVHAKRWY